MAGTTGNWLKCNSGNNPIMSFIGVNFGKNFASATRNSPARNYFGGTTCIRARIIRSLRVRYTQRMGGKFLIFTPGLIRFEMKSKKSWENSPSLHFGDRLLE